MLPRLKVKQRRARPNIVSRVLATQRFNTVLAEVALRCRSCNGTFSDLAKGQSVVSNFRDEKTNSAIQQITYTTDEIRHGRFGAALTATLAWSDEPTPPVLRTEILMMAESPLAE